jgi:hypothetical protein
VSGTLGKVRVMDEGCMTHLFPSLGQEGWVLLTPDLSTVLHSSICSSPWAMCLAYSEKDLWSGGWVLCELLGPGTSQGADISWWWLSELHDLWVLLTSGKRTMRWPFPPWGQSRNHADVNTRWRRWDQNPPKHLYTGPVSEATEPELHSF